MQAHFQERPVHARDPLGTFAQHRRQLGRLEHAAVLTVAQQNLASLPQVGGACCDARATVGQELDLAVRKPQRNIALARHAGRDRAAFKVDVRKLKELGLTESLEVGYRLSPRGEALLRAMGG